MKILVVIASYGTTNDRFLAQLVREYRSMPFAVDIVVLSNINKEVAPGAEVIVGLPTKDPWSLAFGHERIFAERLSHYDLFIYSEDDVLIRKRNLDAFLKMTAVLRPDELAGFIRSETAPDGTRYFTDFHAFYHWDPESVVVRGGQTFAFFTNEHAACYLVTSSQLRRAIQSGGFLVKPHEEKYDLLCTAATDIYTQCGFKKQICISQVEEFIVPHLSNKYVGRVGIEESQLRSQIRALEEIANGDRSSALLFRPETRLKDLRWSKEYYEPPREDLASLVPADTKNVLSIGCGWGATEAKLVANGMWVTGVPVDSVIATCAEARGVDVVYGGLRTARQNLSGRRFDCLLLAGVLHLVPDPVGTLSLFGELLCDGGTVVLSVPNHSQIKTLWGRAAGDQRFSGLANYAEAGTHLLSRSTLARWLRVAGLEPLKMVGAFTPRFQRANRITGGLLSPFLESETLALARKESRSPSRQRQDPPSRVVRDKASELPVLSCK